MQKTSKAVGNLGCEPLKNPSAMEVLCKDIIRAWILPHLSTGTRGPDPKVDLLEVVECILYKLKTGCQWRLLPIKQFFTGEALTWSGVYYHFNEWRKDGSWKKLWVTLLRLHKSRLDLSSMQLDGSHTRTHNGGAAIGYQGRKAARTTNLLFRADNQGRRSPVPRRRRATTTICSTSRPCLTSCATWSRKRRYDSTASS